jgi:hypothetical protein
MKLKDILVESNADAEYTAMTAAKQRYQQLISDIQRVEKETNLYLSDTNVDIQNTEDGGITDQNTKEFWEGMYDSACQSAGYRAENDGADINKLLGYNIY